MKKSIQQLFVESQGESITINEKIVFQMDRIQIHDGELKLRFLGQSKGRYGVALKAKGGGIKMSNGDDVELLHIWDEPGLPREVCHRVVSPSGELRVWNIYRTMHSGGNVTEDAWTGNAGMVIQEIASNSKRYHCSSGPGEFDPTEFSFEIAWQECRKETSATR